MILFLFFKNMVSLDALEREEQAYIDSLRAIANVVAPDPVGKNVTLQPPPTPLSSRKVRTPHRTTTTTATAGSTATQRRRRRQQQQQQSSEEDRYSYRRPTNIDTTTTSGTSYDGHHVEL